MPAPKAEPASATAWRTELSLVVSPRTPTTLRPVCEASSIAAACKGSADRANRATSTPSWANARAMALPMPRLPPVTKARLPSSCMSMEVLMKG